MENKNKKCFSCENETIVENNEFPESTLENLHELLMFCIPELGNKMVFTSFPLDFCINCIKLLTDFSTLKHKCLEWPDNRYEALLDVQLNVKDETEPEPEAGPELEQAIEEIEEDIKFVITKAKTNKCPLCHITLKTKYLVNRHIKTVHTSEKNFECTICQQRFAAKVYLRAHEKTHDELRPHMCQFCGKGFKSKSDLCHHEVIHADRRDYVCPESECCKAFKTCSELHKHKLIAHTAHTEWKYQCDYCGRKFPMKCTLDRHVKTHTNERLFKCNFCEYKGFTNTELKRHLAKHDNVRAFKCFVCSAEYKRKTTLELHLLHKHQHQIDAGEETALPIKLTEKNFVCQYCGKRYANSTRLRTHINTNHCDLGEKT